MKMQKRIEKQREILEENDDFVSNFRDSSANLYTQLPPPPPPQNPPRTGRFIALTPSNLVDLRSFSPVAPLEEEDEMIDQFWAIKITKAPAKYRKKLRQAREKNWRWNVE